MYFNDKYHDGNYNKSQINSNMPMADELLKMNSID